MKQKINIRNDKIIVDKLSEVIYNVIRTEMERGFEWLTNLKKVRQEQGLTQKQLAEMSGVPRISIARYESGIVTPGGTNLIRLASVLKCPAEELLKKAG